MWAQVCKMKDLVLMSQYTRIFLGVISLFVLVSCNSSAPSSAELALVGTWISTSDATVFVFTGDRSYVVNIPSQERITGTYRAAGSQTELQGNRFILEGSSFNIKFLNMSEGFVIDYGDGFTSKAIFRREK
jgi:hypothetical protein